MAASPKYTWTQPVGGKVVVWRPLKMGDHIDLDANYSGPAKQPRKAYAEYAARIIQCGDANPRGFDVDDFREWDEEDYARFMEEVSLQEAVRANSLSVQRPGSPVTRLKEAVNEAQISLAKVAHALSQVLAAATLTEQKLGPLESQPGS